MGKAAVRLGTSEDQREWRCHSEYKGRIRRVQQKWAVMWNMWKSKLGSYRQIWSSSASLSAKFNGGEDYWALRNWCVHACVYVQAVPGCSIHVVWCAAAEVWQWAGWRQESAQSSFGTATPAQRCTDPVWLLTWLPPDASHPCGVIEKKSWKLVWHKGREKNPKEKWQGWGRKVWNCKKRRIHV